jgi:hypothetical protein
VSSRKVKALVERELIRAREARNAAARARAEAARRASLGIASKADIAKIVPPSAYPDRLA